MGGGDLNFKKSWHTSTLANVERVWKAEQAAEAEKQKVQQVIKEKKMEREREEMARMQEEAGGKKRNVQKVEWMYNNVNARGIVDEEREAFLLGTRRVDTLLLNQSKAEQERLEERTNTGIREENLHRDLMNKTREDPLLAIQKRATASLKELSTILKHKRPRTQEKEERKHKKEKSSSKRIHKDHSGSRHSDSHRLHRHEVEHQERRPSHERPRRNSHTERDGADRYATRNGDDYRMSTSDYTRAPERRERQHVEPHRNRSPRRSPPPPRSPRRREDRPNFPENGYRNGSLSTTNSNRLPMNGHKAAVRDPKEALESMQSAARDHEISRAERVSRLKADEALDSQQLAARKVGSTLIKKRWV